MPNRSNVIYLLIYENVQVLDVTGPLQVFVSANEQAALQGLPPPYEITVIAAEHGLVMSAAGLSLLAKPLPAPEAPCDTLIIAGGRGVHKAAEDTVLLTWLQRQAAHSRRVASTCTGAFLLAAAGLLDDHRVVTHWQHCEQLAQKYPRLKVEANPIFINDGNIWTSAGVTAGIDLALALVDEDCGRELALNVARELVVFLKRPGGQSQFSVSLSLQQSGRRFDELHAWIVANLNRDLAIPVLAKKAGMSERSFIRHYRSETGHTPARAIELIRIETARQMLSDTVIPIKKVAEQCGFGSEETMRRSFMRVVAVTPPEYRTRFAVIAL